MRVLFIVLLSLTTLLLVSFSVFYARLVHVLELFVDTGQRFVGSSAVDYLAAPLCYHAMSARMCKKCQKFCVPFIDFLHLMKAMLKSTLSQIRQSFKQFVTQQFSICKFY